MNTTAVDAFYRQLVPSTYGAICSVLPESVHQVGAQFNVVGIENMLKNFSADRQLPYNRKAFYKISLIKGRNRAEYANKVINIDKYALLFATPKVPYHFLPQDMDQSGIFCIFTEEFMQGGKNGLNLDSLPIFQSAGYPIFEIKEDDIFDIEYIFLKMQKEMASDYAYRDDLLRNLIIELIHFGQKLQPVMIERPAYNASQRIYSLFIELLERQFPIESLQHRLALRTAKDFADRLAVHVNHLNRALKEITGNTTSFIIGSRVVNEAKILLKHSNWTISEIGYALGFEEVSYFSNFFKKQTGSSPVTYRS